VLVEERPDGHDPRVVDEDIDRADCGLDVVDELLERRPVRDVEMEALSGLGERLSSLLRKLLIEVADRDRRALARKRSGRRGADSARATRDRDR
jgi:hypothetical protein